MTDRAVIQGSLVEARNVAAHKCVRLYIDVPQELGEQVIKAFGWPSGINPVPVAVARLVAPKAASEPRKPAHERRAWDQISPSQQAGIRCNEEAFQRFLVERGIAPSADDDAAEVVRLYCNVDSRKDITQGSKAAERWYELEADYQLWFREVEAIA